MKVFLVSTNDDAWLVAANHASTAVFRVVGTGALDDDGPLQVTAREYSESAWMVLVSSTVVASLRHLVSRSLVAGTHEELLTAFVDVDGALFRAKRALEEAAVINSRASGGDIVCVSKILEPS